MFWQYAQYGDTEVINGQRALAYVANGITPVGAAFGDCLDCGDLAEATGQDPYTNPLLDQPAWYSVIDPDSAEFAGVYAVEITGYEGSTIQVPVVERVGDGGFAGGRRAATRTIAVTADLIGGTTEATSYGLAWLSSILHPPCVGGDPCGGSPLHLFSTCPAFCVGVTDQDALPETFSYTSSFGFDGKVLPVQQDQINYARNPSFELGTATTVTNWQTGNLFGFATPAQAIGSIDASTVPALGGARDRTRVARVTWPNTNANQNSPFFQAIPAGTLVEGRDYQMSCWVFCPTGSPGVQITQFAGEQGHMVTVKDQWVYCSWSFRAGVATSVTNVGIQCETGAWAGTFCYVDAFQLIQGGAVRGTGFSGTNIEGWNDSDTVDHTFTGPASRTVVTSGTDRYLELAWKAALDPGTNRHASYGLVNSTTVGEIYTIQMRVWVPAGSPDVQPHCLFHNHGTGQVITQKDTWVTRTLTVKAGSNFIRVGLQTVGAASGGTARVDFLRAWRWGEPLPYFDGLTADNPNALFDWLDGGTVDTVPSTGTWRGSGFIYAPSEGTQPMLRGPGQGPVCDQVTVTFQVYSSAGGNIGAQAGIAGESQQPSVLGPLTQIGPGLTSVSVSVQETPEYPLDWFPVLLLQEGLGLGPVKVMSLDITHRPVLSVEECTRPYRRIFHNVVTVDGPRIVERRTLGDTTDGSTVWRVEWTWQALEPWAYAEPTIWELGVESNTSDPSTDSHPGIILSGMSTVDATTCPRPAPELISCADSPCCPPLILPPTAPVLVNPCIKPGLGFQRRVMQLPPEVVPAGLGVLTWTFINDSHPKAGIRVRIWEDPDPDFGGLPECEFVDEFTINFLAADQTLIVDGTNRTVRASCGTDVFGNTIWADSLRNVLGSYGGPFSHWVIGCGRRYQVAVDVPTVYNGDCAPLWTNGQSQGALVWSVDLSTREG